MMGCAQVYDILILLHIIGGVIELNDLVLIDMAAMNENTIRACFSEIWGGFTW